MLTVGLTGGIGSGKTTVSDLFQELGAAVIDTDIIARQLVETDNTILHRIIANFGNSILLDDGKQGRRKLDRKKLAKIVFDDEIAREQLESILHPAIRSLVRERIQSLQNDREIPYIIVVIPLLFETGFDDLVDRILVISADEKIRIERVRQRDQRSLDEINAIISHQVTDQIRINGADDIIKNDNDINTLTEQVQQLHDRYRNLSIPD